MINAFVFIVSVLWCIGVEVFETEVYWPTVSYFVESWNGNGSICVPDANYQTIHEQQQRKFSLPSGMKEWRAQFECTENMFCR